MVGQLFGYRPCALHKRSVELEREHTNATKVQTLIRREPSMRRVAATLMAFLFIGASIWMFLNEETVESWLTQQVVNQSEESTPQLPSKTMNHGWWWWLTLSKTRLGKAGVLRSPNDARPGRSPHTLSNSQVASPNLRLTCTKRSFERPEQ